MKRPPIKEKAILAYVEELEKKLEKYEKSPYVKTYLTLIHQVNDLNDQLEIQEKEIEVEGQKQKIWHGRIDLFGDKDEKEFERGFKYMLEVNKMLDNIENIRKKMTTEEKDEAKKLLIKEHGVEEFINENGGK